MLLGWQGAFDCLAAVCYIALLTLPRQNWREPLSLVAVYGYVTAPALLAAGVLKLVASVRNRRFHGRGIGFVALGSCFVSLATCYCAPTAMLLLVYGVFVYVNPSVARAFAAGGPPPA
jgi:uncharacterized membrane protein HdeD (DUF308 family)